MYMLCDGDFFVEIVNFKASFFLSFFCLFNFFCFSLFFDFIRVHAVYFVFVLFFLEFLQFCFPFYKDFCNFSLIGVNYFLCAVFCCSIPFFSKYFLASTSLQNFHVFLFRVLFVCPTLPKLRRSSANNHCTVFPFKLILLDQHSPRNFSCLSCLAASNL